MEALASLDAPGTFGCPLALLPPCLVFLQRGLRKAPWALRPPHSAASTSEALPGMVTLIVSLESGSMPIPQMRQLSTRELKVEGSLFKSPA